MERSEESAFPLTDLTFLDDRITGSRSVPGLTVRELFAAMAMTGLLAHGRSLTEITAEMAVKHADALITALEGDKNAEL
ncbi:hypothetical protein ACQ4M4_18045 [Leptolyngbya sp. AN02str]|uniref:hypothetical protein n=1 Tax=Leptolyngbya sp. AN02str TaxID=3423363 RepID=UPI003D311459